MKTNFLAKIKEDWETNGRDWTNAGFRALFVYRIGVARMSIKWKLFRAPFSVLYRLMFRRIKYYYGIELPYTVQLGSKIIIEHQHGIVIHGKAVIGNNCIIRQGVTIGNRHMDKPNEAPIIGNRVNVGAGAKILGNIRIGDDVNIGANAVVFFNVPDKSTVVGNPGTIKAKDKNE